MKTGSKRWGLIIGIVVVLGGFGYLLSGNIDQNLVYFRTPAELLALGDDAYDKPQRLGGLVVPGSVQWNADALDLRFRMEDGGKQVEVHATKAPPQMFRGGIGAVVEGKYTRDGVFEATNVLVKHSNEYKAPPPGHNPRETYKSLLKETN
jgi:cytochrome c-type biogenesis protein CcmE